jgi:hypothetical protein
MNCVSLLVGVRQLVFVNSAAYAYTQIPQIRVDQHTALLGANHLGKTPMLNALKLFMLPEARLLRESAAHCELPLIEHYAICNARLVVFASA